MSDLRTAAQRMLAAVEDSGHKADVTAAADDLRAALAQQAEHFCDTHCTWADHAAGCVMAESVAKVELMTTGGNAGLANRRRLTDDEIGRLWFQAKIPGLTETSARLLIRAAEEALRSKGAPA